MIFVHSIKQDLTLRRIKLTTTGDIYQIRPDFMIPYMVGKTHEIEKAFTYAVLLFPSMLLLMCLVEMQCTGIGPMLH